LGVQVSDKDKEDKKSV